MIKKFLEWIGLKEKLHKAGNKAPLFKEGEIWWCAIGENVESLRNLEEHLKKQGASLETVPHIIQYNKRDLTNISPVAELSQELNFYSAPEFEAIAIKGFGVFDSLKVLAKLILKELKAEPPTPSRTLQREDTL